MEKVEGGVVTFAASAENSKRVGSAFKEGVSYDQVASMMSKTALRSRVFVHVVFGLKLLFIRQNIWPKADASERSCNSGGCKSNSCCFLILNLCKHFGTHEFGF